MARWLHRYHMPEPDIAEDDLRSIGHGWMMGTEKIIWIEKHRELVSFVQQLALIAPAC